MLGCVCVCVFLIPSNPVGVPGPSDGQKSNTSPACLTTCDEPWIILLGGVSQGAGVPDSRSRQVMPHAASFLALLKRGRKWPTPLALKALGPESRNLNPAIK